MKVNTRYFGKVEIESSKIIHMPKGIFGFEEYKDFTILYDVKEERHPFFSWFQCVTEQNLAFPIVNPFLVKEDYNPTVEDALLEELGEFESEDLAVFLLATVPEDIKKTSVNMKAPLIINTKNQRGMQIVVENTDYPIKYVIMPEEEE